MKALILAGGKGTRLLDLTNNLIPKPMAELKGKPILQWTIERLKENGITELFISVSHLREKIIDYFEDGSKFGVKIEYLIEEEPLGSGGALYYLKGKIEGDFIVCSGDVLFNIDIPRMVEYHKNNNAIATLFTHPNLHPFDSDLVVSDKNGRVTKFDSKHNIRNYYYKNNVNAGFFVINEKALDYFKEVKKCNMEHDFIQSLIDEGKNVFAYKSPEYIKDVGTVERFKLAEKEIDNGLVNKKCLKNKQKAIFIDRDGVINKYKGFIKNASEIELVNRVVEAIGLINRSEYLAIVVSNQPVIARGDSTFEQVEEMFNKIETILGKEGVYLDGIYYCPHHPHSGYEGEVKELKIVCDCRKPNIGMLKMAEKDFNIDLSKSYMIGDTNTDVQTGINAGMPQIKVKSDIVEEEKVKPTYKANDLYDAVNIVLNRYKMKKITENYINNFFQDKPEQVELKRAVTFAIETLATCVKKGKKILICGNGGSAADSEHIAGELLKSFMLKRTVPDSLREKLIAEYGEDEGNLIADNIQGGIKCIPLTSFCAYNTAFLNDCHPDMLFAQLVNALGDENDIFIGISTSGNSKNVCYAAELAKVKGLKVISMTGHAGGKLRELSDILINVPSNIVYKIQEMHLPVYHLLCLCLESEIFEL